MEDSKDVKVNFEKSKFGFRYVVQQLYVNLVQMFCGRAKFVSLFSVVSVELIILSTPMKLISLELLIKM